MWLGNYGNLTKWMKGKLNIYDWDKVVMNAWGFSEEQDTGEKNGEVLDIRKRGGREQKIFGKVSKEREILSLVGLYSGFGLGGPRTEFLELGSWQDYPSWQGGRLVWSVEFSVTVKGLAGLAS